MSFESARGLTFVVGADVPQGRFVKLDANANVVVATAETDDVIGVSLEAGLVANPETGNPDSISVAAVDGAKVEMESSAAISVNARLASDGTGQAVTLTPTPTTRQIGIALEEAFGAGEFITVLLVRQGGFSSQA